MSNRHDTRTAAPTSNLPPSSAAGGPAAPDAALVRRLVAEVVERLRATTARPQPGNDAASGGPPPEAPAGQEVTERVISLEVLERLPKGTRRVRVPARAVITPSARERAADTGLEISRAAPAPPASARPFLVAHAAAPAGAVVTAAALVRAIPGGQALPAAGLVDSLAALALEAERGGGRGVLLTERTALAVAAANRHPGLRAVTALDAARARAAIAECAANLLVLDPAAFSTAVIVRLSLGLAQRPAEAPPAELSVISPPAQPSCGCRGNHP